MPSINEMKKSRFLTQHDVGEEGKVLTIANILEVNVAPENKPKELKWTMDFEEEGFNPLVLARKNQLLAAAILKSDDTDNWIGKQIVAYQDPTIDFGGKVVGGIRLRALTAEEKSGGHAHAATAAAPVAKSESKGDAINDSNFGDVKVHVGKCKGQALRDLTPEQVAGLNTHWLPAAQANSKPTADDQRLMKALAIAGDKNSDAVPY